MIEFRIKSRRCKHCGVELLITQFSVVRTNNKTGKVYHSYCCNHCYYKKYKARMYIYAKDWAERNRQRYRELHRKSYRKHKNSYKQNSYKWAHTEYGKQYGRIKNAARNLFGVGFLTMTNRQKQTIIIIRLLKLELRGIITKDEAKNYLIKTGGNVPNELLTEIFSKPLNHKSNGAHNGIYRQEQRPVDKAINETAKGRG